MVTGTNYECIKLDMANAIATLTMNRPDRLNAMNSTMRQEMIQALEVVAHNDDVRVMVITGAGTGFCSGADLEARGKAEPSSRQTLLAHPDFAVRIARLEKPTIAAVNGAAAGAGLSIALVCDIRIAADTARFAPVWVKRGLVPDNGATYLLPKLIGLENALELMYTGDIIDAARAKELGMVSRVVPAAELMTVTYDLAGRIAKGAPISQELAKRLASRAMIEELSAQLVYEAYAQDICHKSLDYKEGVASFLERREAHFKGL